MSEKVTNRNRAVLDAALAVAAERGYRTMTRDQVAERAGVAVGSVNNAFGTMDGLRDAVISQAVSLAARQIALASIGEQCPEELGRSCRIIAQGLADRHPATLAAPEAVREAALALLAA